MTRVTPPRVRRAILDGNTVALQEMGRAGGRAVARNRQVATEIDAVFAARKAELRPSLDEEMYARAVEANEHICPLD